MEEIPTLPFGFVMFCQCPLHTCDGCDGAEMQTLMGPEIGLH